MNNIDPHNACGGVRIRVELVATTNIAGFNPLILMCDARREARPGAPQVSQQEFAVACGYVMFAFPNKRPSHRPSCTAVTWASQFEAQKPWDRMQGSVMVRWLTRANTCVVVSSHLQEA